VRRAIMDKVPQDYLILIRNLVSEDDPNEPSDYIDEAIERLAHYYYFSDYDERALKTIPNWYGLYDLVRWTMAL
jgi:hypothetical protein